MIILEVIGLILLLVAILVYTYLAQSARRERSILIRQNLVYLIAFVNYFDWLEKNYVPSVIGTILSDEDYVKYMKKNGLPEKLFSDIVENAVEKSNVQLKFKTNEVLEAIKLPLSSEINALLENE